MRKKVFIYLGVVISLFLFYGCSKRSASSNQAVVLSGQVSVPDATIYINSVDAEGKLIKKVQVKAKEGKFKAEVPYSGKGGYMVIIADGGKDFIRSTKTIKYKNREDIDGLRINLELLKVRVKEINVKDGLTITDAGKKYIRVRLGDKDFHTANKGGAKFIDLSIPFNVVQVQDKIEVRYRSFRPSDPDDYRFFPGEDDERGNRLVSVGFDYIDIVNPVTGKTVFDKSRIKQGQEVLRILRWVDKEQLNRIRNKRGSVDEDPSKGGVQVTFYAFDGDRGMWVTAGKGVFVNSGSVNYTGQAFDDILRNGCQNKQDCESNGVYWNEDDMFLPSSEVYAVVSITNPDLSWKNLDYVAPGDPAECEIVIVDSEGNPVGTWVEVSPDENGNIEYTYGFTSPSTGRVILSTVTYGSPENGVVSYYNPKHEWVISPICKETASPIVKFVEGCRCTVNIDDEKVCEVRGRVTDQNGDPIGLAVINIEGSGFSTFTVTDAQGNYNAKVPCNRDLSIYVDYSVGPFNFNVNGIVGGHETSDDGQIAVVNITLSTCYAEGRILFDGNPVEGVLVTSSKEAVYTGTNGDFRVRVACNNRESLFVSKDETKGPCNCKVETYIELNVNGSIGLDEVYDDGVSADIGDFELAPCFVTGGFTDSRVQNKDLAGADISVNTVLSLQNYRWYTSSMNADSSGTYRLPILCNVESMLNMSYGVWTADPDIRYKDKFRVDGVRSGSEVSDSGRVVDMGMVDVSECEVNGSVRDQSSQSIPGTSVELTIGADSSLLLCTEYPCMKYSDYTDTYGNYRLGALCNRGGTVNVTSYSCDVNNVSFNVNGTLEPSEFADDGTSVTINFTNCQ